MKEESNKREVDALKLIKHALTNRNDFRKQEPLTQQKILDLESDRKLKKIYAKWFIGILIGQLIVMNILIYLAGINHLILSEWELNIYMGATLAEVFGVVLVITKNLFPSN